MAYFADTYSEISNRFLDWLKGDRSNTGGNVADVTLDYANLAQQELWQYRAWSYLLKDQSLSLNASNLATLPADFGRVVRVGHDADGDNKLEVFYWENGDRQRGYKIRDVFAKATGHAFTMQFYIAPSNTVTLVYQAVLSDFAGSGTEYSFFPASLMLHKMQELYLIDAGMVGNDLVATQTILKRELRDYEQAHQYVNMDMNTQQLDVNGVPIRNEGYSLDGGHSATSRTQRDNSYDEGSVE